ncbi:GNAT family N-acetyltransferase [Enterococcus sp. LJL128]|uniref:GNAT family N-acetyltransferase n=1 Tax=Enterococcus sp. LJL51 TaxID=3416656 RepID=UPI003CEB35CA
MLIPYRKEHQKIAIGLLSFHDKLEKYHSLLHEIDRYEQDERLSLYFWMLEQGGNIQGLLGVELLTEEQLLLHDISINPSLRGKGMGFQLLDELQSGYNEHAILGTQATAAYLTKWQETKGQQYDL